MPKPETASQEDPSTGPSEGDVVDHMGRFDHSFFVRMIVGFLLLTLAVAVLEVGLRFGAVVWEFQREDPERAQTAARELADDVRSIMLNEGGPVASRTVYPILERNFRRDGLRIAVRPSEVTESSIRELYGFDPEGISRDWPDGRFREGTEVLRAEEFCIRCHVDAEPGDLLGRVTVRAYLDTRLDGWLEDLQLTASLNLAKAGIHTVILFLLLRVLMAPLLSLRSAVARLGLGSAGLRTRARVVSADEFGELAHDLNTFLDRVTELLADLRRTTGRTVALNNRLTGLAHDTHRQLERVMEAVNEALPKDEEAWTRAGPEAAKLPRVLHEVHELRHHVQGIGFLEEQLQEVAEDGERLLARLLEEDVEVEDVEAEADVANQ